jgi:Ca2+-binding RTX toxin-like protein
VGRDVVAALGEFEKVSGLRFTVSTDFVAADLKFLGYNFSNLGEADFPGDNRKQPSTTDFESFVRLNTANADVQRGAGTGSSFAKFLVLHETGHALGLAHPHDTGNGSNTMPSTFGAFTFNNDDPLDNERYTVMSYEVGGLNTQRFWGSGHTMGPMALDIAVLQRMYGANTSTNTGSTTYRLTDTASVDSDGSDGLVSLGQAYFSIWDAGGTDRIEYGGALPSLINLNSATLTRTLDASTKAWISDLNLSDLYAGLKTSTAPGITNITTEIENPAWTAGGFFSRILDASPAAPRGGFSIANGAVIENGAGGSGNDVLIGNAQANRLEGNNGSDAIIGAGGNDALVGGAGNDELAGGAGNDTLDGGDGTDTALFSGACRDYDIVKDPTTGNVTISHVRGTLTDGVDVLSGVETAKFSNGRVDLTVATPRCAPLDYIFLVDLSGSYADDLANFKNSARAMANTILARDPNATVSIASFVDLPRSPFGAPGDYVYRPELAATRSVDDFEKALTGLKILDGGDWPEAQWPAVYYAARGDGLNLRAGSERIIHLATDAPAHSASDYGLNSATIAKFLADNAVSVRAAAAAEPALAEAFAALESSALAAGISGSVGFEASPIAASGSGIPGDMVLPNTITREAFSEFMRASLVSLGGTPLYAVSGSDRSFYNAVVSDTGKGVVVSLTSDGSNIVDTLNMGLSLIFGEANVIGTDKNDTLNGSETVNDVIFGGLGNDLINGPGLNDTLDGGGGNDTVTGGLGDDFLRGGAGVDSLDGGDGHDTIEGGPGNDVLIGGNGNDVAFYLFAPEGIQITTNADGSFRTASASGGTDTLRGIEQIRTEEGAVDLTSGLPELFRTTVSGEAYSLLGRAYVGPVSYLQREARGTSSSEVFGGTRFNDFFNLFAGDDAANSGLGDDVLDGGTGSNFLTGGAGKDVFFLDGRGGETVWSTIVDWETGEQLSVWGWQPGVSRATWNNLDGTAGYEGVTMHGDLNGDGLIDTSVTWSGLTRANLPTPLEFDGLLWFTG